ncbi:MAG: alpha-L-fucosidase [Candidatus Hydrogenedentes bacterium]|nr:alpha-L-fucosidase [Candidatus Hydrogenedentota bacterium]
MKHTACTLILSLAACATAVAAPHNPDTDWFRDAGYGIFVHFLWDVQCVGPRENTQGKAGTASWDECVKAFDTDRFADQMKEMGAGYVIFTMMQRTRYVIAPNETYDALSGYAPGEACATRDLVEDLYQSLSTRGIPLMLYWTGDGPREDKQAAAGMGGWNGKVTDEYVQHWADVVAEYSRRYGGKVKGWWVDGCYEHIGYNETRWGILARGLKAGNPHAIIALNNPSMKKANSSSEFDDFTTGEVNEFKDIPDSRWRDGKQFHVLSYLGDQWCGFGCRYSLEELAAYVSKCNAVGGVVSIDVGLYRDGSIPPDQLALLKQLRPALNQ